jgi:hypothetical protein
VALTKAQRNALIEDAGVDPAVFKLKDSPDRFGFAVAHHQSRSTFDLNAATRGEWFGYKQVGTDPVQEWEVPLNDWDGVLDNVRKWIREITEYEATPDLWELYQSGLRSSLEQASDNVPFTPAQQTELGAGFDRVMAQLGAIGERFELTAAQVDGIKETVHELKDASKRLGKKDFLLVLIGQALTMAVPPAVGQAILGAIFHAVGHVLGLPSVPPALPL